MTPFAELALTIAIAVCVPLALRVLSRERPLPRYLWWLYAIAASSAVASMLVPHGLISGLLAVAWLVFAIVVTTRVLVRAAGRSTFRLEEALLDGAFAYLVVGAAWLIGWRYGSDDSDAAAHGALLTAVHFHYAGFASLVLCGLTSRSVRARDPLSWRTMRIAAVLVLIGPALVAIGILSASPLEQIAAVILATATAMVAWSTFHTVARRSTGGVAAALRVSALSAGAAMGLAIVYAAAPGLAGTVVIDAAAMARTHGILNALGYSLVGLVAWSVSTPEPPALTGTAPFSSLRSWGRVGADFFERHALARSDAAPTGLVDTLGDYVSAEFDPERVDPRIRAFYEQTASFDLTLFPRWRGVFRALARSYAGISGRLEQVHYAIARDEGERIESRIVALDPVADGRPRVRGWVRWYERTGKAIYVAAYATHRDAMRAYMNIAFPLPGGNLASILRAANEGQTGLSLMSIADPVTPGHEGVYFATAFPIRLPIDECIRVWAVDDPAAPDDIVALRRSTTVAVARHEAWMWGIHALTLDYTIQPVSAVRSEPIARRD